MRMRTSSSWFGRGVFGSEFRDGTVEMGPGEGLVVPRGVEHRTCADEEAEVMCFEPAGVVNTGDAQDDEFTAPNGVMV